jgi:hypothetical protein
VGKKIHLILQKKMDTQVKVFNINGVLEKTLYPTENSCIIDVGSIGIYLIDVESDGKRFCQKVIVQ